MNGAEENEHDVSERQLIEEYLKLYCIEDIVDEAINIIVELRPKNPYVEMARIIESKSMPEIIDVKLCSVVVANGAAGVEATVTTNLGDFKGCVSFGLESNHTEGVDMLRDLTIIQERVGDRLKKLDPREMSTIDDALLKVANDEPSVMLALSMACCRAGARHKSVPLYQYISELASSDLCLPMPVPTILTRACGNTPYSQQLYLYCASSSYLNDSMEHLLNASYKLTSSLKTATMTMHPSSNGSHRVTLDSIEKAAKVSSY